MRTLLARVLEILRPPWRGRARRARQPDYKAAWNEAALNGAEDAVLTGATADHFEFAGQKDAQFVGRYLGDGDEVLNIGCGVGRVDRYVAPKVRELWAVDVSGEMILRARERLAAFPNVHLREVGNREFLGAFEANRFDLVFSFLVLQHLEKEDAFLYLREALRVLRPGGVFVTQFPNFLAPVYAKAFAEAADVDLRSPARVRPSTEAEVRQTLALAGFELTELWLGGHEERAAEIYVVARKPRA
ncbi:MAG TPA: class I SAM-dependent methyltransferase [Thermoanaerobaculia bacterium]|jgi:SAM-dependent methyltransferase|nr:class I SAM-dependent methyltransferase [Thermoanaerobaculia bacterium]